MGTVQSHTCEDVEHFMTQPAGSAVHDTVGNSHKELYRILKQDDDDVVCRPSETYTATKSETSPVKPTGVHVSLIAELCSVPNDSLPITHDMNDYYLFAKRQDSPVSSDDSSSQPPAPISRQNSLSESSVITVSDKPVKSAVDDRSLSGSPCKSPQQPPPPPATSSTSMHAIYVDLFKTTEERMRDLLEQRAKQRLQQATQQSSTPNTNTDSSHANRATNPAAPMVPKSPYDDHVTAQTPRGSGRTTGSMLPMLLGDGVESPSQRRSPLSSFDRNCSKDSSSVVRRILSEVASTSVSNSAIHQQQQRLGNEVNQLSSSSTGTKGLPVETSSSLVTNIYPWQRDTKPSTASQQQVTGTAVPDDTSRLSDTSSSSISDIPLDLSAKHDNSVSTQSSVNIPVSSKLHSSSQHHQAIDLASVASKLSAHLAMTTESSRLSSSSSTASKRSSLSELVALPTESRRQMLDSMLSSKSASSAAPASPPSCHINQLSGTTEAERGRTGLSTASNLLASNLPSFSQGVSCSNSNEIAAAEEEEVKKELPSHQDHIFRSTAIRRGGLSYYPEAGVGKKSTYHQRIFTANSASPAAKQKQQQPPSNNPQQRQQPQTGGLGESRNTSNAAATSSSSSSGLAHRSNSNVSVLRQLSPNGARALQALQCATAAQPTQKEEEALKRMSGAGDDLATLLGGGAVGQRPLQVTETVVATVQYAGGASNSLAAATAIKNLPPHPYHQQQQQLQLPRESSIRAVLQQKLTAVNASKTTSNERGRNDGLTLRERLSVATDKDLTLTSNKSAATGQQQGTLQPLQQQRVALMDGKNRLASLLSSPSAQVVELDRTSSTSSINQFRDSLSAATNNTAAAAANNRRPLVANSNGQTSQSTTALQGAATPNAVNVSKPTLTTSSAERKTSNSSLRRLGATDRFAPKPSTTPLSKTSISHSHASSVNTSTVTSSCVTSPTRTDSAAASSSAVPLKRRWLASATNDMDDVCGDSDGGVAATKRRRSASLAGDGQQAESSCTPS